MIRPPLAAFAFIAATLFASAAFAVDIPHTFTPGETISASEMNENFEAVEEALEELAAAQAGVAFSDIGTAFDVPTNVMNVGSVTLTCPSDGFVLLTLVGSAVFFGDNTVVDVGIGMTDADLDLHAARIGRQDGSGTGRYTHAFTSAAVASCTAGPTTFYANAEKSTAFGSTAVNLTRLYLIAHFVPQAY